MKSALLIYLACIPVVLICDGIWLGVLARGFYRKHLGYLFADRMAWGAAAGFYLLHAAGIVYFAVLPALRDASLSKLMVAAVFFGLVTYGTYDLTNWATVRNWPPVLSLVDMAWGCVISLIVASVGYAVGAHTLR
jgi:uncharacterized membrane protein